MKNTIAGAIIGAAALLGLAACGSTPDGLISEIEGGVNGDLIEFHSTSAGESVEIAVRRNHDCDLEEIVWDCLKAGDILVEDKNKTPIRQYNGEAFEEESVEED